MKMFYFIFIFLSWPFIESQETNAQDNSEVLVLTTSSPIHISLGYFPPPLTTSHHISLRSLIMNNEIIINVNQNPLPLNRTTYCNFLREYAWRRILPAILYVGCVGEIALGAAMIKTSKDPSYPYSAFRYYLGITAIGIGVGTGIGAQWWLRFGAQWWLRQRNPF